MQRKDPALALPASVVVGGPNPRARVAADGAGFNPGYRVAKNPSYPGITDDDRKTLHALEMIKPDIWLAQHNEYCHFEGKRKRVEMEGVRAWTDTEGYRRFVASRSAHWKTRSTMNSAPTAHRSEKGGCTLIPSTRRGALQSA